MADDDRKPSFPDLAAAAAPVVEQAVNGALNGAYSPIPPLDPEPTPGTTEHDSWTGREFKKMHAVLSGLNKKVWAAIATPIVLEALHRFGVLK